MSSDNVWPQFVLRGYTPYKVIDITQGGFLAVDMIDGDVDFLSPPSFHDEFADDEIWVGTWDYHKSFTAYNKNRGSHHTFFFNLDYQLHREDGPAQIVRTGEIVNKTFWLNGYQFASAEEWFEALPDKKKAVFNLDEINSA